MDSYFGPSGLLARSLPAYQFRSGQMEMAKAVAQLLGDDEHLPKSGRAACLALEAETGLGKTLAYLIPAALSGQRVVISTNTRNLQDQILQREIPLIHEIICPDLKALCVKGRQNYLCLYRWHQFLAGDQHELITHKEQQAVERWLGKTVHADRSELPWMRAASPLWQKICCHAHCCIGPECPDSAGCFLHRLRRDAAASNILVVNHHLLFSDLAVRKTGYGEVLPRYESVIFDEAHHLEAVATTYFGFSFSRHQILDLTSDLERTAKTGLSTVLNERQHARILQATQRLNASIERFVAAFPAPKGRYLLPTVVAEHSAINPSRADLETALDQLATQLEAIGASEGTWIHYAGRTRELAERFALITAEQFDDITVEDITHTYWYERTERNLTLFATPVDVAADLHATLFNQVRHCVFTSATLTTGSSFRYFLERMGLPEDIPTLQLPSPFDYPKKTLLYIPGSEYPEQGTMGHQQAQHELMATLINHAHGRTLVLFTSFAAMDQAYQALCNRLPYPLIRQGESSRQVVLKRFSQITESVLFAVASFWEGIDVPGETLSMVVIDKLPFEVPTDPVIMARTHRIKALGGNPFADYQVPRAVLTLRQGVGRLMRTAEDRGVIAILDTRLFTKGYGRQFLNSLPPSPITRKSADIAAFFSTKAVLTTDTTKDTTKDTDAQQ